MCHRLVVVAICSTGLDVGLWVKIPSSSLMLGSLIPGSGVSYLYDVCSTADLKMVSFEADL